MIDTSERLHNTELHYADLCLWWIITIFFACAYAWKAELFKGPDEWAHFLAVEIYKSAGGLLEKPEKLNTLKGEVHQPPLLYLVSALALETYEQFTWADRYKVRNPEREKYKKLMFLRLFWIPFNSLAVVLTFLICRLVFPSSRLLAHAAAALHSTLPQFSFVTGMLNNDGLCNILGGLLLLETALLMHNNRPGKLQAFRIGIWMGLCVWIKLTPLVISPIPVAALILKSGRKAWISLMIMSLTAAALAGPLLLYNYSQWGDPVNYSLMFRNYHGLFSPRILTDMSILFTTRTFFHHFTRDHSFGILPEGFCVFIVILGFSGLLLPGRFEKQDKIHIRWIFFLFLSAIMLNASGLLKFGMDWLGGDQGRYLYPSLSAIVLLVAEGWRRMGGKTFGNPALIALSACWVLISVITYFFVYLQGR